MAPRTRSSTLRQSGLTAAQSTQTRVTATATATPTATPRRGRPPKKQSAPSKASSGAAKKPAKRGRPPAQRPIRRTEKLPIESPDKSAGSSKKKQQEQSVAPQHDNAPSRRTLEPVPKSNRRLPTPLNKQKAGASALQGPGERRTPRAINPPEVSTRPRQEEPDEAALRHTLSNYSARSHSLLSWLQTTETIPPPEDIMAGHTRINSNGAGILKQATVRRRGVRFQNEVMDPEGSTPRTTATGSTVRTNKMYKERGYREVLAAGVDGVHLIMDSDDDELSDDDDEPQHRLAQQSEALLQQLQQVRISDQPDARFHRRAVKSLLKRLHNQNECGISHELHEIVCPSAGGFRDISFNDRALREQYNNLVNQWDEPWSNQPSLLPGLSVPRPDYCVGFSQDAFTDDQRNKLSIIASERTSFKPTSLTYFPFLTCEVKGTNEGMETAENQNGYSMLVTVRAMVELFRAAKLEHTCSGHIMAFSMSYNHELAYIYAHYPIIDGQKTTIYRQKVYKYLLSPGDTPDTARAWNFVRNVYEKWAPQYLLHLREAIDAIDFSTPILDTDLEAMSVDTDRGTAGSANPIRRGALEQPAGERNPKRTRK